MVPFDPLYHGFYLLGLAKVLGWAGLEARPSSFPSFERTGLAFQVPATGARVYVDADDTPLLDRSALRWCDIYAKVNLDPRALDGPERSRLLALGPSMAVRVPRLTAWLPGTLAHPWWHPTGERTPRELGSRWWQVLAHRLEESAYVTSDEVDPDYLYFLSSVWAPQDRCNGVRLAFLSAVSGVPGLRVEGGFAPPHRDDVPECTPFLTEARHAPGEYLQRTRRSVLAFNTPAVLDCLGWRLAEYLALGKAILTTRLGRVLPAPLEHGRHVHVVDASKQDMVDAVQLLRSDSEYRGRLQIEGRRYYDSWLAPAAVGARLLRAAGVEVTA